MRIMNALIAVAALAVGCGAGVAEPQFDSIEQNWTIPDYWTCATKVYETGGARTIGNDSFRIETGVQPAGTLRMYHPIDASFASIATAKGDGKYFNWTSSTPIRAVIVTAGPGKTTIFDYRPGATAGKGLVANDNVQSIEPSSLLFCFDSPGPICG